MSNHTLLVNVRTRAPEQVGVLVPNSHRHVKQLWDRGHTSCLTDGSQHLLLRAFFPNLSGSHVWSNLSVQFISLTQASPTLCDPMDCSMPASLSITNSRGLLKLRSIESLMPSNHLILCHPLLLLPSILPSIRVFSNESVLHIRWQKYWSFSFSISPSSEYSGLIFFRVDWLISLQSKGLSRVFSNTTVQKHQFFSTQFSL